MATSEWVPGGCSRKLGPAELDLVLDAAGDDLLQVPSNTALKRHDSADACRIDTGSGSFVTSVDALYPLSEDPYRYGYIAALHGLSDIYAVGGQPLWATVCAVIPSAQVGQDGTYLRALLKGANDALIDDGAMLAGGHTVLGGEPLVIVAATGAASTVSTRPPRRGDAIVLSKPVGVGVALSALAMGLAVEGDLVEEYDSMTTSNRLASQDLLRCADGNEDGLGPTTDVSGFGLLHALRTLAPASEIEIDAPSIPLFSRTASLLQSGATSVLGDKNLIYCESFASFATSDRDLLSTTLLMNDPQTSGGLLAAVGPAVAESLVGRGHFRVIGRVECATDDGQPKIRVVGSIAGSDGSETLGEEP